MSDAGLRDVERRWRETGAPADEARYLAERIRAGNLSTRALLRAALLGSPAARIANPDFHHPEPEDLNQDDVNESLRIVFGSTDIPPRAREFLGNLVLHDREARATLTHYELVQEGDKAPPDSATALKALTDHLKTNTTHLQEINSMQRPVLQLIPIYEPEGAGFQRMVSATNAHRREDQEETFVWDELQNRWSMHAETPGKIVGWQVAVTEGAKVLPPESNPYLQKDGRVQRLEDQLSDWQQHCQRRGLQLCNNKSYALLQMQEVRQAAPEVPLNELGLDPENVTYLGDHTRQPGSRVPRGRWFDARVFFYDFHPGLRYDLARFRFAVVVPKIL